MICKPPSALIAPRSTQPHVSHVGRRPRDPSIARARRYVAVTFLAILISALIFSCTDSTRAWAQERSWPSNFSVKSAVCDAEEHAVEVMQTYRKLGTDAAHKLLSDYAKQKNDKGEPRCSTVQANFVVIREVLHAPGISVGGRTADGYVLYVHLGSQVSPDFYVYTKRGYLLLLRPPARERMA